VAPCPVQLELPPQAAGIARPLWQRPWMLVSICCLLLFAFSSSGADAQEWILSPHQHGWGRCKPGSWKTVRVISDMLDSQGNVTSTTKTETTTTLVGKKGDSYTLEVEVTVEIGDRRITSKPKQIIRSFKVNGDGKISLKRQGRAENLDFNGTSIEVDKLEVLNSSVAFGSALEFELGLTSASADSQPLIIDYAIHHQKANGSTSPKVFKWKTLTLERHATLVAKRRHPMKMNTTRVYYPGTHKLEILINGTSVGVVDFELII